jgi:hypothetical protein
MWNVYKHGAIGIPRTDAQSGHGKLEGRHKIILLELGGDALGPDLHQHIPIIVKYTDQEEAEEIEMSLMLNLIVEGVLGMQQDQRA